MLKLDVECLSWMLSAKVDFWRGWNTIVTVKHAVIGVSNDNKHDSHGVKVFEEQALNIAMKEVPSLKAVHQWTDGAASQYKGKTSFADISVQHLRFSRNFFETSHGKSVCDGLGAIVKNACFRAVLSEKTVISDATALFTFCKAHLEQDIKASGCQEYSKREFVFVHKDQVIRNRPEAEAKTIKGTQKLHAARNSEKPGSILIRNLSCYCKNCIQGNDSICLNKEHVDSWSKKVIKFNKTSQKTAVQITDDDECQDENTEINEGTPAEESIDFQDPVKGDFVTVYLESHGRKHLYIAQILEMDDHAMQAKLQFMMNDAKQGLYFWPPVDDISWENYSQILVVIGEPELCENVSTNRRQFFYV